MIHFDTRGAVLAFPFAPILSPNKTRYIRPELVLGVGIPERSAWFWTPTWSTGHTRRAPGRHVTVSELRWTVFVVYIRLLIQEIPHERP